MKISTWIMLANVHLRLWKGRYDMVLSESDPLLREALFTVLRQRSSSWIFGTRWRCTMCRERFRLPLFGFWEFGRRQRPFVVVQWHSVKFACRECSSAVVSAVALRSPDFEVYRL